MPGTAATQALPALTVQGARSASRAGFSCREQWGGTEGSLPQPCQPLSHRRLLLGGREASRSSQCVHSPLFTEAHLGKVDYLPLHYSRL